MRNTRRVEAALLLGVLGLLSQATLPVSSAQPLPIKTCSGKSRCPLIYVYDLPAHLYGGPDKRCESSQFAAETVLLPEVQKAGHVTHDPSKADYFWVQANFMCRDGKMMELGQAAKSLREVVDYVKSSWPYFDASNGRNHIFTFIAQSRVCSRSDFRIPELSNSILLTHWSITHPNMTCALPGQHLVVPTPFHDKYTTADGNIVTKERKRPIHLLAVGVPEKPRVITDPGFNTANFLDAIKYRTANLLHGKYNKHIMHKEEWAANHYIRYHNAHFCLVTLNNLGIQLKLAIQSGCIPIFIQEEGMAWGNLLPYDRISLSTPLEHLFRLPFELATLRAQGEKMKEMRRAMDCIKLFMSWRHRDGKAVDMLMCDLRMRLDPSVSLRMDLDTCRMTCE